MIEIEVGNYNQAKRLINRSLAIKPGDPFFLNNSGYVKLLTNDLEGGREDIDRSIVEDPDNAWAYRNKGLYYNLGKRYTDATRLLLQALKMDPFTEKVNLYLGDAYSGSGNKSEACKYYQQAFARKELDDQGYSKKCTFK
jgi:tetratricopeptide (TPR) repeat protein